MKRVSQIIQVLKLNYHNLLNIFKSGFFMSCLLELKIPKYQNLEIVSSDFVINIKLLKDEKLDMEYEISEMIDHHSHIFKTFDIRKVKNFIESYIIVTKMASMPIFITEIKLQEISEYKSNKRDKKIDLILKR